jgi:hypothetical protein
MRRILAASAALGLCLSGPALAIEPLARPCLTSAEMHGMVGYFLPNILSEVSTRCAAQLPPASYLRGGLVPLMESLDGGREAAWLAASAAFFKLAPAGDTKELASLSDRALRPLVDELLTQKLSIPVSAPMCGEINDIAEALMPLNAEQSVHLISTILAAAARNDNKLRSCPRSAG